MRFIDKKPRVLQIMQDGHLRKKVENLFQRMKFLNVLSKDRRTTEEEYYILQLEREMLQISKHLIFMLDLIKRERKRVGLLVEPPQPVDKFDKYLNKFSKDKI